MIEETLSTTAAGRFYDWLGAWHDVGERYERRAKRLALRRLDVQPGQRILNIGVGTGKEQATLWRAAGSGGTAVAIDLSRTMLALTRERAFGSRLCQADARRLPFAAAAFDRLLCTYVLDLIPLADIPAILAGFRWVLKPDGRLVLVSLTEGVDRAGRAVVGLWKAAYAVHPLVCGGCRPLQLLPLVQEAGFGSVEREVVTQMGVPSEVIIARP